MIDRYDMKDLPLVIDYKLARAFMSRKEVKRLKKLVSDYNAVKPIDDQDFHFLAATMYMMAKLKKDEKIIKSFNSHRKTMRVFAIIVLIAILFFAVGLMISLFYPEFTVALDWGGLIFPMLTIGFMVWVKEKQVGHKAWKTIRLKFRLLWWVGFIFNAVNIVLNGFDMFVK